MGMIGRESTLFYGFVKSPAKRPVEERQTCLPLLATDQSFFKRLAL